MRMLTVPLFPLENTQRLKYLWKLYSEPCTQATEDEYFKAMQFLPIFSVLIAWAKDTDNIYMKSI